MKKIKIKVQPEDFLVDEITTLPLVKRGEYSVYRLKKRGWNTVDALQRITRDLGLPWSKVAYGGKKDRYGLTTQWITLQDPQPRSMQADHYSLEFMGHAAEPMGPTWIQGNRFQISVRDLEAADAQAALDGLEAVKACGVLNYFDDQRFGGYDPRQGFLAERLLKHHYNGALKAYLCSIHPEDKKAEKDRKRALDEQWKDWTACRKLAVTRFEREAFAHLEKHSGNFVPLLQRIPREELSLAMSAYQSFIWNELVRRLLQAKGLAARTYPGAAGDYIFFPRLKPDTCRTLASLTLPTMDARAAMPDALSARLYDQVLAENGIARYMFNRLKVRQAFFKAVERRVVIQPSELSGRLADDEIYPGRTKLQLRFTLTRGSYATMLVKSLFAD